MIVKLSIFEKQRLLENKSYECTKLPSKAFPFKHMCLRWDNMCRFILYYIRAVRCKELLETRCPLVIKTS